MARSPEDYADMLVRLLPPGLAWPRDPASRLGALALAFADELARLDARAEALLEEADPRTTLELLDAWERVADLPDPCAGDDQTLDGRRARLVARLIGRGDMSIPGLTALAAALGYTVTITTFPDYDCDSDCDAALTGGPWRYAWTVNAPPQTIVDSTCDSFCDEPIRSWGNAVLECTLTAAGPAHAIPFFAYA